MTSSLPLRSIRSEGASYCPVTAYEPVPSALELPAVDSNPMCTPGEGLVPVPAPGPGFSLTNVGASGLSTPVTVTPYTHRCPLVAFGDAAVPGQLVGSGLGPSFGTKMMLASRIRPLVGMLNE